jgi:hypothetical protein
MSEVKLNLVDAERVLHGSIVDYCVAARSPPDALHNLFHKFKTDHLTTALDGR